MLNQRHDNKLRPSHAIKIVHQGNDRFNHTLLLITDQLIIKKIIQVRVRHTHDSIP